MHLPKPVVGMAGMAALAAAASLPRAGDIVGGQSGDIDNFPYQISLQQDDEHSCGGSIISPNHIVTAAHCVYGESAEVFKVRAGSSQWASGGQLVDVSAVVWHPDYDQRTVDNDIAVLTLAQDLEFGPGVASISLAESDSGLPTEGTSCVVSGWGATFEGGSASSDLQYLDENVINRDTCAANYQKEGYSLTSSMFCAGFLEGGKDSCQGDSGGPLVDLDTGILIGVVSWGLGCARRDLPGVYASIASFRQWIQDQSGV